MKVLSFVEGANPRKGGLGLVGVPMIAKSLADQGHQGVLVIGGRVNPGREAFVKPDVATTTKARSGQGTFGIMTFRAWSRWAFAPAMLWRLCRYARNADFIILHSLYSFPVLAGYLLARLYRKPYGLWPHGVLAPVQRQISVRKKKVYNWLVAKSILSNASVLFYSALGERNETYDLHLRKPSVIIPHGMDIQEFANLPPRGEFRSRYLSGHSGPLLLFLSRLNPKKGLDILVRAFALVVEKMASVRLAIVGSSDPPEYVRLVENWIREYKVSDYVVMPGLLTGHERLAAFADADVFVFPSEAESFGFAMFEAMASGIPVVASSTLDYAAEVQGYDAGLVVRRDPQEFANAIVRLLGDADLRQRMGKNGLQLARAYSWESCGEKIERTIQSVLQGKALPADLKLDE